MFFGSKVEDIIVQIMKQMNKMYKSRQNPAVKVSEHQQNGR
jgi:hypothetical protein